MYADYKILSPMTCSIAGKILTGGDRLRIRGIAAAAAIMVMLTAFTATAVPRGMEDGAAHTELEGRVPETQAPEKGAPETVEPGKKVPKMDKKERLKIWEEFIKDPLTVLENRKKEIEQQLKEGRISKEEADAILRRIDKGIAEIKEFSALPLEEKRARLIRDCKDYLDSLVEKGEMDREKAQKILEKYSEKINKWDGTGYPRFFRKPVKPKCGRKERDL